MFYCDRTDIIKGIDFAKSNNIKKYIICNYWFYNHGFKFQDCICNGYHDFAIFYLHVILVKNVYYRCFLFVFFHGINQSEAISLLENFALEYFGYI